MNSKSWSFEDECPHIIKVSLVLMRTLDGRNGHLAHPLKGLTLNNFFDIARHSKKSVVLISTVHSLSNMGSTLFSDLHTAIETFNTLHSDVLASIGYKLDKQIIVVE